MKTLSVALVVSMVALIACGRTEVVRYPKVLTPSDAGTIPDAGFDAGLPCMPGVVTPLRTVPTVMFVIDRSGSMAFDLAGHTGEPGDPLTGPMRWTVLFDSLRTTLPRYDQTLSMGVTFFPDNALGDSCSVSDTVDLAPALNQSNSILQFFAASPLGGTPTFEAMRTAGAGITDVGGAVLVLVTDGEPNCNSTLNPATCVCTRARTGMPPVCPEAEVCLDDTRSVNEIQRLSTNRMLNTYVIGVGDTGVNGPLARTLDQLALAGGVPLQGGNHFFYAATNAQQLTTALEAISARITRCTFLTGVALEPEDRFNVRVGNTVVPMGSTGWTWVDQPRGRFVINGSWCDRALAGDKVELVLACH